jgi:hypothetical protein
MLIWLYRVPIYSISSWVSLMSLKASQFIDPIRDVYEVRLFDQGNAIFESDFDRLSRSTLFCSFSSTSLAVNEP